VRRLHQIHVALFLEEVAGGEVTPIQYGLLSILSMQPGIDQFTLGEELGLDRANVAGILKRLEARGWVRRMVDADNRRRKLCVVTPAGKAFLKVHDHEMQASQQRLLAPLAAADRRQFLALLERLVEGNNDSGRAALRPGGKAFGESEAPSPNSPTPKPRRGASR
jgi:DNA-binding MarR family transcriptional regulator